MSTIDILPEKYPFSTIRQIIVKSVSLFFSGYCGFSTCPTSDSIKKQVYAWSRDSFSFSFFLTSMHDLSRHRLRT
jgi:hypothetical protein